MNLSLCVLLCNFLVLSTFTLVTGENASGSRKSASRKQEKENIFIDDEDFDGSGDATDDFSGSGNGPTDDVTETTHHGGHKGSAKLPGIHESFNVPNIPTDDKEHTLPMPQPKPQSPAPPPSPDVIPVDPTTKTYTSEPTERKTPEEKHPIDTFTNSGDKTPIDDNRNNEHSVYITNNHDRDRTTSFFAQPGILAAVIGGAVVGLLCAILVVMFIVYRMRKKDEGSYALEEMKRCPATNPYMKPNHREFFA